MTAPAQLQIVTNPDDDVISKLEELLELARRGECRQFSYIATLTGNRTMEGNVGYVPDRYVLSGMWLAMAMNHARGF